MKSVLFFSIMLLLAANDFAQILPGGDYVITLADGGKALDADASGMTSNGGIIHLWDKSAGPTQIWTLVPVSGDRYSIVLAATGKALDADGPGMYTDGGRVQLWDKRENGYKTQSWKITSAGNNSYTMVLADGGKALDAAVLSMYDNDGLVHLWSYNGGKTQKWIFTPAISNNNPTTNLTNLTTMSDADYALWMKARNDQQGIIGNDYRGIEEIGSACFERPSNSSFIPDDLNFWYPQHEKNDNRSIIYFKRTLAGVVRESHQADIEGIFRDYDLNVDIYPSAKYNYLLTDVHPREYTDIMSAEYNGSRITPYLQDEGQESCDDPASVAEFTYLEAEIAPDYGPHGTHDPIGASRTLQNLCYFQTDDTMCVYGVWLYDKGHCCHPEIHPAEQLWWNTPIESGKKFYCNVVCDASQRFWWKDQMDDGTKLKPWGAPPVKGIFAIAFELTLDSSHTQKFEVSNISDYNVIEYANADQIYNLVYQDKTLVSFIPRNNAFKVSYEKVGLIPGSTNKIGGFLVIETSVGTSTQIATTVPSLDAPNTFLNFPPGTDPNTIDERYEKQLFMKVEGYYLFNVIERDNLAYIKPNFDDQRPQK